MGVLDVLSYFYVISMYRYAVVGRVVGSEACRRFREYEETCAYYTSCVYNRVDVGADCFGARFLGDFRRAYCRECNSLDLQCTNGVVSICSGFLIVSFANSASGATIIQMDYASNVRVGTTYGRATTVVVYVISSSLYSSQYYGGFYCVVVMGFYRVVDCDLGAYY